ncbi:MAG TPA: hypothetical protein VFM18_04665 [Methanosarcina sp.]|nr:hypothetical protein [Methanosarcina sp.]
MKNLTCSRVSYNPFLTFFQWYDDYYNKYALLCIVDDFGNYVKAPWYNPHM